MPALLRAAALVKSKTALALFVLLGMGACVAFPVESDVDLRSGATPPQRFFVLVAMPKEGIVVRTHANLASSLKDVKEYSFLLPRDSGFQTDGNVKLGYRVQRPAIGRQIIEVSYEDDEGIKAVSVYEAEPRAIKPLRSRVSHPAMGIVRYVVPAILLWLLLWTIASLLQKTLARKPD